MDYCESVDKDADTTVLKENTEVDTSVIRSNCEGESLILLSH
jgi:hypothetical protein